MIGNSAFPSQDMEMTRNGHGLEKDDPIMIDFPLKGEWMAPNTPGKKVPSHGTDQLGQRYAIDLLQVNWDKGGIHFYNGSKWRYHLVGVPLNMCYCWGKEVCAPLKGRIIEVADGCDERKRVRFFTDLLIVVKNGLTFNLKKKGVGTQNRYLQPVLGNYIIMECEKNVFALLAHLRKDSIRVSTGQDVVSGDVLGQVGHSGNSTAPHLHFQLMDSSDLIVAKGVPFLFREYQLFKGATWSTVLEGVPSNQDRIKH